MLFFSLTARCWVIVYLLLVRRALSCLGTDPCCVISSKGSFVVTQVTTSVVRKLKGLLWNNELFILCKIWSIFDLVILVYNTLFKIITYRSYSLTFILDLVLIGNVNLFLLAWNTAFEARILLPYLIARR